uniref:Odorant receptor n=1 Tax=Yemma signatus TaxID=300820 RepID=A0A385H5M5_9HEMI|nr:odorant receptor [Yemma signatus]
MAIKGYRKRNFPFFLEKTGLWFNPSRNVILLFLQKSRAFFCTISTILQLISIFGTGYNKKTLQETAFFGMVGILISTQLLHYRFSQPGIWRLFELLDNFQADHKQEWQKAIFEEESKKAWKVVDNYWKTLMVYCAFYLFLPIFLDFIIGNIWPSLPDLRVPVPLQGFVDFTGRRSVVNFFLSLLGSTWALFSIMGHIGVECTTYLAIIYTRVEMKIISVKIGMVSDLLASRPNHPSNPAALRDPASHHQRLLSILDQMNEIFGLPIVVQNVFFSVCFCVAMYSVSVVESMEDLMPALQNLYSMSCCMGIVCYLCVEGESLETQNNNILSGLYDLPWYQESVTFRRQLNIMIRQSSTPFVINFHQRSHLNVNTFMQIINTAYSYFMMLKSTT